MLHVEFAETDTRPSSTRKVAGLESSAAQAVNDPFEAIAMELRHQGATLALVGVDILCW